MVSRGAALFMEMGTGKTKAMIDVTGVLHANGIISRALVVAPLPIVDAWGNEEFGELTKHAGNDRNIWFPILGKSKKQREDALKAMLQYKGPKMVWGLINIEGLVVVKDALKSLKPDLMLLDESTIIKNRTAQRTKLAIELFEATPFKVISSGNPIPKSPDEIFAQYKLIEPGAYGSSFMSFREKFFEVDYFNKIKGFKPGMEAAYNKVFHDFAFVKRKQDCLSLPPKVYLTHAVDMTPEQAKLYGDMEKDALAFYKDKACAAPVVITKFLRLSQIAGGTFPTETGPVIDLTPNPKIEAVVEILEGLPKDEQVVIWARFQREIELIAARLEKEGIKAVTFYGKTSSEDRIEARRMMLRNEARVFVGNPATGGKGLNELIGATTVIYYSNDYSAENRQQSEDRNHRNGTVKVTYIDILANGTIDREVLGVLRNNKNFSDAILERKINGL